MNIPTLGWDLCCDNFCLFGPKELAYFSQVLSDKFRPLHSESCPYWSRCLARLSTVGSSWEKTRQADRVQCSRCDKQSSSAFLLLICWEIPRQADWVQCNRCLEQYRSRFPLPYLESTYTVVWCCVGSGSIVATALDGAASGISKN
jgi:hypothetical protein